MDTHDLIDEKNVHMKGSFIPYYVVYLIKYKENGPGGINARICPNWNLDNLKNTVRKDWETVQFDIMRLPFSTVAEFGFKLGYVFLNEA